MNEPEADLSNTSGPIEQDIDESKVRRVSLGVPGATEAIISGTMLTARHNWGPRKGYGTYRLNWPEVMANSTVLASVCEGAFVGNARYLLYNVAPRSGGVDIHVHIDWDSPIPLQVDYFAVLA